MVMEVCLRVAQLGDQIENGLKHVVSTDKVGELSLSMSPARAGAIAAAEVEASS